jgi:glycosyltransferase involved in cell wall biosynthesis
MKLLINTATLSGTGVTQVAVSFITECIVIKEHEYHVFLSPAVRKNLCISDFPLNFHFYFIKYHPFYGIKGLKIRRKMKCLEKQINPDCAFSVFGPSYWTPKVPHLMGYAYPHYVYLDSPLFSKLNIFEKFRIYMNKLCHRYYFHKNGKYFVCETDDVSDRLSDYLSITKDFIFTVNNTCGGIYSQFVEGVQKNRIIDEIKGDDFRLLSLCSPYKHKNLTILNQVIPIIKKTNRKVKFVLSIEPDVFEKMYDDSVRDFILNVGPIPIAKCPQLYSECDALFLPTLLECFSANYPEAMCMGKPILTSNLSFAHSICANAALYFDPMDPNDIVDKIFKIIGSKELYNELKCNGFKQLSTLKTSSERANGYLRICSLISTNKR